MGLKEFKSDLHYQLSSGGLCYQPSWNPTHLQSMLFGCIKQTALRIYIIMLSLSPKKFSLPFYPGNNPGRQISLRGYDWPKVIQGASWFYLHLPGMNPTFWPLYTILAPFYIVYQMKENNDAIINDAIPCGSRCTGESSCS